MVREVAVKVALGTTANFTSVNFAATALACVGVCCHSTAESQVEDRRTATATAAGLAAVVVLYVTFMV
jgi:hypothetical protein